VETRFLPYGTHLKKILRSLLHVLESTSFEEVMKFFGDMKSIAPNSPFYPISHVFRHQEFKWPERVPERVENSTQYKVIDFLSDCIKGNPPPGVHLYPRNWSCVSDARLISDARDFDPRISVSILGKFPILRLIHSYKLHFRFYRILDAIQKGNYTHRDVTVLDLGWDYIFICPPGIKAKEADLHTEDIRAKILERMRLRQLNKY